MKITILGAAGRTGRHVVQQALEHGHSVTALVRNPARLDIKHERLEIIQGDALDAARVEQAVADADAVISVLGPSKGAEPMTVSRAMGNILDAMRACGVRRLVMTTGAGVGDPLDQPTFADRAITFLLKRTARTAYEDMRSATTKVRAADLDWTVVRAPMLTDDPASGQVKTGYLGKGVGVRLSRADLADFILRQLESDAFVRQAPVISN